MQIQKPLLAGTFDPDKAKFPYLATPKIDGIRFLMVDGLAVSRSFKPIRNEFIQDCLHGLPDGIDGELTVGENFQSSSSGIMSIKGEPDFHVWIFDYVDSNGLGLQPYERRIMQLNELELKGRFEKLTERYTILRPVMVHDLETVQKLEEEWSNEGYEGVMLRDPIGTYKFGRSSTKENIILKVKKFLDAEGLIVGFKEKMSNQNVPTTDAFGHMERKGGKDGMVPANTLGAFRLMLHDGREVSCGSGLNDELRKTVWENQEKYEGQFVKFKYMSHGIKDLPRHPIFLGFRDMDDMS